MGQGATKFNVCVTAGPDAPDMLFHFRIKEEDVTVGQSALRPALDLAVQAALLPLVRLLISGAAVIDAVTETIQDGLESDEYEFDWDGEVTGLVPYFGDDWENLPEGAQHNPGRCMPARASQC